MPHTVTLADAKTHLEELIAEARRGEEVIITEDDQPVARLTPPAANGSGRRRITRNGSHFSYRFDGGTNYVASRLG